MGVLIIIGISNECIFGFRGKIVDSILEGVVGVFLLLCAPIVVGVLYYLDPWKEKLQMGGDELFIERKDC